MTAEHCMQRAGASRGKSPGHASPLPQNHLHCPGPLIPVMVSKVESPLSIITKSTLRKVDSEALIQLQIAFCVGIGRPYKQRC